MVYAEIALEKKVD
jgi:hypothetical protein